MNNARHLYVYSPSSAVRDRSSLRRGVARLEALGYEVEVDEAAAKHHMRFAGDDEARVAAVHRAAASGASAALITRGGYGLTRILPAIDLKRVFRSIERGTRFIGFSDFTALQCALLARGGVSTWAGPSVVEDFGTDEEPDEIMSACFDDLMSGQGEGAGWRLPVGEARAEPFEVHGTLWGGNLSVFMSLVGTPQMPSIERGILFFEDVAEHPFRVERMLTQLLRSGVLGRQRAIVLGQFNRFQLVKGYDRGFGLSAVVAWLRAQTKVPIFTGLPFGHVPAKVLLPVGARVRLAVAGRDAFLLWGHGAR